jgi:hypothetical protein
LAVGSKFIDQAMMLIVDDQVTYDIAIDTAKSFKNMWAVWEAKRKSYADPLNALKEQVQNDFMPILKGLTEAERITKNKALQYMAQQEEIRRKAQAELDRIAREAVIAAEKEAAKLQKAGKIEEAAAVRECAAVASAPVLAPAVTQSGGTGARKSWKGKVTDLAALVKCVAQHPEYINLIEIDQSALNKLAQATAGNLVLGGVEFYKDAVLAIRK